jgi:xanthine dehydrogenase YagR molybdenum-binding subunit
VITVGKPPTRIDGPLKVSGTAKYTSDYRFERMVYAIPVGATIANGRVASLELDDALAVPGVVTVFHRGNIGELHEPSNDAGSLNEKRPPLADDIVRYYGQYVALVVAETFEQASEAAACVRVTYADQAAPELTDELIADGTPTVESQRGDPAGAFARAAFVVDQTYVTAAETHNPIELHATVAIVDGDRYTLFETTQAIVNQQRVVSSILGVSPDKVRVITKFLGSGFGGKLWPWTHSTLAAAAAKSLQRPVKLVLTRKQMFETVGHRPRTQQHVRMSASADGALTSLRHEYVSEGDMLGDYVENCGEATAFFYGTPNLLVTSANSRHHVGSPTSMRGPGAVPGLFATELAYDELAQALEIDPVELRMRNEPDLDLGLNIPFSSRHYLECLTTGSERFGWGERTPAIGSMRRNGAIIGWGMAGATWLASRLPAQVRVELWNDGSVRVFSATQDIGTGTYTVLGQMAAEAIGVPLARVIVEMGDTLLPPGPTSGGSMATASLVPALLAAVRHATKALVKLSGDPHAAAAEKLQNGALAGIPFEQILRDSATPSVSGSGKSEGIFGAEHPKFSFHSYGAQYVEVAWRPELAQLRVTRMVTVIDAGRMINERTARNQIEGALIMGVGMSLFERTHYDRRSGAPINANLADYVVATHADAPKLDVTFLNYPDLHLNELGARGVGEIGLAGVAAAIAAAVHHATGIRVRSVPIEIEALLGAMA